MQEEENKLKSNESLLKILIKIRNKKLTKKLLKF